MVATHNKIITMTEAMAEGVVHVEVGMAMNLLVQEVMKTLKNHHQVAMVLGVEPLTHHSLNCFHTVK